MSKCQIILSKAEKLEAILNDFDANFRYTTKKSRDFNEKQLLFFEDILPQIKIENIKDYEIFMNIFYLFTDEHDFDEIVYLSGYKDDILSNLIKKYSYLFNIIICDE